MTREQAINYLRSSGFSEEQIATIECAFVSADRKMDGRYFVLTMYKNGRYFMTQSFDTLNLARKAAEYFMTTSQLDNNSRGYVIYDDRFNLVIVKKGDVGDDNNNENG